jgi:hypothetical protein
VSDSEDLKSPAGRESGEYMAQDDAMLRVLIQELNRISSRGSEPQRGETHGSRYMPFLPCFSSPRTREGLGTSRSCHFRFPNGAPGLNVEQR